MQLAQKQALTISGDKLDEAVALAQGWHKASMNHIIRGSDPFIVWGFTDKDGNSYELWCRYHPSTNGSQCMEIMEREDISCRRAITDGNRRWIAYMGDIEVCGETAMIAICRCFVFKNWA